jgi:hypothetical protein
MAHFAQQALAAIWDQAINQILYDGTPHQKKLQSLRSQRYDRKLRSREQE